MWGYKNMQTAEFFKNNITGIDESILFSIHQINNVIEEISHQSVFESSCFEIDDLSYQKWIKLCLKKEDSIRLSIIVDLSGVIINIEDSYEVFSIALDQIKSEPEKFSSTLKSIFTSKIKIISCFGNNYSKICFINNEEKEVLTVRLIKGLYLKIFCDIKYFHPIMVKGNVSENHFSER